MARGLQIRFNLRMTACAKHLLYISLMEVFHALLAGCVMTLCGGCCCCATLNELALDPCVWVCCKHTDDLNVHHGFISLFPFLLDVPG
jgi:hypothetical protein